MSRKTRLHNLNIRLSPQTFEFLEEMTGKLNISRSLFVEFILREKIKTGATIQISEIGEVETERGEQ